MKANTIETTSYRSYPCVGTVGRGSFLVNFTHGGKPLLFSGTIRVHRIGGLEDPDRRFYFECSGKSWPASRWYDTQGKTAERMDSEPVAIATEEDYYKLIIPAIERLEQTLSAEANSEELEPIRVGLKDCWKYRTDTR